MTVSDNPRTGTEPVNGKHHLTVVNGRVAVTPRPDHEPYPTPTGSPTGPEYRPNTAAPVDGRRNAGGTDPRILSSDRSRLIDASGLPETTPEAAMLASPADATVGGRRVRLTPASAITLRPTHWLWDGRIPHGALVLGPGREGIGKSLFCAWLAAQVTHGRLPGVHHGQPRAVVYAATEDSWERTIAGRLLVAGADMDRVYRVDVESLAGTMLPLSLPRDCDDLAEEIGRADVALLVLDPLISAVDSRIDVNGEKLREALEPLVALADRTGCAIFGLAHFNKASGTDVLSRITGSRAFSAVARAVIAFARDHTADDGSCVISQVKNNLGRMDLPSLRYVVESVTLDTPEGPGQWGRLRITGETDTTVDDLLNDTPDPGEQRQRKQDAAEQRAAWLLDYLTAHGGSALANDVYAAGQAVEPKPYSEDQLKRVMDTAGVTSIRTNRVWVWQLTDPTKGGSAPERQGGGAPGPGAPTPPTRSRARSTPRKAEHVLHPLLRPVLRV
jgi:hypothetical protein